MTAAQAKTGVEVERLPELPEPHLYEHYRGLGNVLMPSVRQAWINGKSTRVTEYSSQLFTAEQMRAYATAALAAERAETVRMREENEKLREALEKREIRIKAIFEDGYNSYQTPCVAATTFEETWLTSETRAALSPSQGETS